MKPLKIGISIGDINGIGPEVILKTFLNPQMLNICTPVIYGSSKVLAYHKNTFTDLHIKIVNLHEAEKAAIGKINVVNCWKESVSIDLGKPTEVSGKMAQIALSKAVDDLKSDKIDALVTAPINKAAMQSAGFKHTGHTEFLQAELGGHSLMLMTSDNIKVGLATNHHAIKDVAGLITRELILEKIFILEKILKQDFGYERPTIAVLGLNPHAGDDGTIGAEDKKIIRPAVEAAKKKGVLVNGPFPADGFFGSGEYRKYDVVLAMYHDQGLIPFKLLSFGEGVNFTGGLEQVRTSPDHGTAYEIAGKNLANPASFRKAIYSAIDIVRIRRRYLEDHANPIVKRTSKMKEFSHDDDVPTEK